MLADEDEVVETSDVEEREELLNVRRFAHKSPRRTWSNERDGDLPRKRPKLLHPPPTDMLARLSVSPQKTPSSQTRSRSSSMTLEQLSQTPGSALSRSPTVESQEPVLPKALSEVHPDIMGDEDGISQDPLLLCTPPRPAEPAATIISTTPPGSPPGVWTWSPAMVPPSLPSSPPGPAVDAFSDDVDMLFTPVSTPAKASPKPLSPTPPDSPRVMLSPSSGRIPDGRSSHGRFTDGTSPPAPSTHEASRSPSPSPGPSTSSHHPPPPSEDVDHEMAVALEQENTNAGRYPLRKRKPAQLMPYSTEQILYRRALEKNPEAIVKNKALARHNHDVGHYEDETQQDEYAEEANAPDDEEDAEWLAQERRRLRREEKSRETSARPATSSHKWDHILGPPSEDSDDELEPGLAKDIARAEKAKREEEQRKRREEKEPRRRLKAFPALPEDGRAPSVLSTRRRSKTRELEDKESSKSPPPVRDDLEDMFPDIEIPPPINFFSSPRRPPSVTRRSPSPRPDNDRMDWGSDPDVDAPEPHSMEVEQSVPANDVLDLTNMDEDAVSDADQPLEIDLPKSKLKYLQRLWPISMIKQAAKGNSTTARRRREEKRRERQALDENGELAPGQSRVKKSANPRSIHDIRGDSESEVEILGSDRDEPPRRSSPVRVRPVIEIPSDSESDDAQRLEYARRPFEHRRQAEPENEPDDHDSGEDTFDEDDLEDYILAPVANGVDYLRDPSLIDYMLTRERPRHSTRRSRRRMILTRYDSAAPSLPSQRHSATPAPASDPAPSRIPQPPSSSRQNAEASSSKYRLDVTTSGARRHGHTKQTLLDYHVPSKPKTTHSRSSSRPSDATVRRTHQKKKASRPNVGYLFRDEDDDEPASDPVRAPRHRAEHHGESSSRSRGSTAQPGPSRPRVTHSTSGGRPHAAPRAASSRRSAEVDDNETPAERQKKAEAEARRVARARKKKLRKQRAKAVGVWCNNREQGQVVFSGVRQTFVTVDIEDEDFHRSLIPEKATPEQRQHWSTNLRPSPPPVRRRRPAVPDTDLDSDIEYAAPAEATSREEPLQNLPNDMNVPFLQPGKRLDQSSYITKGSLYELVNVVSGSSEPVRPVPLDILDISLDPETGVDDFCSTFPEITKGLFSFATDLPLEMDDEEQGEGGKENGDISQRQWLLVSQAACRLISWHRRNAPPSDVDKLRQSVEKGVLDLASEMDAFEFKSTSVPVLLVGWFMVETLARAGQSPPNQLRLPTMPKPLKTAVVSLMRLLLDVPVRDAVQKLEEDVQLDSKTLPGLAAEIWVRMIHLFQDSTQEAPAPRSQPNLFWSLLIEAMGQRSAKLPLHSKESRPFNVSEHAWGTIFTMCACSQFSLHGVVAGQPRLSASWDAVAFALKLIDLEARPDLEDDDRRQHDEYLALLVHRCMALRKKWHWSLSNSSAMFNLTVVIFQSRKFANLLHETRIRLPDFVRFKKWDLVSSYNAEDTAYTVFLKLIVQTAQEDPMHKREKPSPKVKKLLSMAVPIGGLPEYDPSSKVERQRYRSMYYNRLAATAVAAELDIRSYDDRIAAAQKYGSFDSPSNKLQLDVLGGLTGWAQFLVSRSMHLTGLQPWIKNFVDKLKGELKTIPTSRMHDTSDKKLYQRVRSLMALGASLLSSIRFIYDTHIDHKIYPEPCLIEALVPLLKETWLVRHRDMSEHVKLFLEKLFEARYAALPKPERPKRPAPPNDEEESQDYWSNLPEMDLNLIDDVVDPPAETPTTVSLEVLEEMDKKMNEHLRESNIRFPVLQQLDHVLAPPPTNEHRKQLETECDTWIRLSLSCFSVHFDPDSWKQGIKLCDMKVKDLREKGADDVWSRRAELSVTYHILLLHPMSYEADQNRAIRSLVLALVSPGEVLENAFTSHLLSIGGLQHPLLRNTDFLPPPPHSGDYEFSPEEFAGLRLSLFRVILYNLNTMSVDDRQHYSTDCADAFSSMKEALKADHRRQGYDQFCRDAKEALINLDQLADDPKFEYWVKRWDP